MPSSNRLARHFCWFFIAIDLDDTALSPVVRSLATSNIYHYTETDPGRHVVLGYCRFKRAQTFVSLAKLTPYPVQWIPALHACDLGLKYNVRFSKWATEDFDIDTFLHEGAPYPWLQLHAELKLLKHKHKKAAASVPPLQGCSLCIFKAEGRVWFRLSQNKLSN